MSYMIAAGFDEAYTAHLARAALARLQTELSLSGHDLVVVTRNEDGRVDVCQAVEVGNVHKPQETFWTALVNLLLGAGSSLNIPSASLAAIGIDSKCRNHLKELIGEGLSSVLVLVDGQIMRDQVLGVLRGFHGKVFQVQLKGNDRDAWRRALTDSASESCLGTC